MIILRAIAVRFVYRMNSNAKKRKCIIACVIMTTPNLPISSVSDRDRTKTSVVADAATAHLYSATLWTQNHSQAVDPET